MYIYSFILFDAQQLRLKTVITSGPFWIQKRTPHFETYPFTCLVEYHWRLDYANKPPTSKQIGLNRCSFGDANKMQHITSDYEPNNDHEFIIVHT